MHLVSRWRRISSISLACLLRYCRLILDTSGMSADIECDGRDDLGFGFGYQCLFELVLVFGIGIGVYA